ncbi:hypothetical protein LTR35_005904 [Friedmanniomyces endolithicus]|uniref:Zn(2)-C6 fungal-type domain-containing protein n=1 Tax=Friedmanniomyces endolithicus TaxID=329885 RepID=A0AAN6G469_9PEZI|nr:hypothetical protein LTR35_005904 [Friedmanniomyces endolithicus]KAK0300695.1 hypothetical protein LTS00_000952 [Friedmanniomyces endolithicus]KAK0328259.1 hypothetical protein LTR82_000188 [Friedmanniomyces endolithicus]KAK1018099.1 hypothetical protein LTR54_001946 [Friedmanniomyces endolithicus]
MVSTASEELSSHRACVHCRSQKVRCLPDTNSTNADICSRCAKAGRPCVFTPMQKRKQRKRTDTRVAELEREMRTMRAALEGKQHGGEGKGVPAGMRSTSEGLVSDGVRPAGLSYQANAEHAARSQQGVHQEPSHPRTNVQATEQQQAERPVARLERVPEVHGRFGQDVIDRGLLSMATARQLVETYKNDLFPHFPTIPIDASISADELRRTRPTLFLAVIAAASGKENPDLSATLDKEVLEAYATRSLMNSEKSLELVQALLISAVWYHPPSEFGQLKYYEYIHMAATKVMDLGLGTRPKVARSRLGNAARGREPAKQAMLHPAEDASNPDLSMTPRSRNASPDTGSLESRRTFLACYMICTSVSLSMRRPNMLRVSSYVRECVEYLHRSLDALPSDRILVHWLRLVMIAEEVSVSFSYDDPGGIASITELRAQLMLKDFEKRLTAWWGSVPMEDRHGNLTIMYYTNRLFLHEIALHVDHSPEDFRAPYQMGTITHPPPAAHAGLGGDPEVPTQILAEAIAECINSSHAVLNAFFAMDVDGLRALPVFGYVRVTFAAFALAKLCLSAAHPEARLYRVVNRRALNVESYMDRAVLHVRNVVGTKRCRVPAIFLALLFKLRQWCMNPELIERAVGDEPAAEGSEDMGRGGSWTDSGAAEVRQLRTGGLGEQDGGCSSGSGSGSSTQSPPDEQQHGGSELPNESARASSHKDPHLHHTNSTLGGGRTDYAPTDGNASAGVIATLAVPQSESADWAMQLDSDYMRYFGDMMDTFTAEGGLTGLDDWMPSNLGGTGMDMGGGMALPTPPSPGAFGRGWHGG